MPKTARQEEGREKQRLPGPLTIAPLSSLDLATVRDYSAQTRGSAVAVPQVGTDALPVIAARMYSGEGRWQ